MSHLILKNCHILHNKNRTFEKKKNGTLGSIFHTICTRHITYSFLQRIKARFIVFYQKGLT